MPIVALSGDVDGINLIYSFGTAYLPGTIAIWLNGQLLNRAEGNPWFEIDPNAGLIRFDDLCYIPRPGDSVVGFYPEASLPTVVYRYVQADVTGRLQGQALQGMLASSTLYGSAQSDTLSGMASPSANMSGILSGPTLTGVIERIL